MIAALLALTLHAAPYVPPPPDAPKKCDRCAEWNQAAPPLHVFGNTYWVGVHGLSVVAIDTGSGVILLDGALPQSVPLVKASLTKVGLKYLDIKLVTSGHAHFDHAGGIAAIQHDTNATVVASARTAEALKSGCASPDDPQAGYGCAGTGFARVAGPVRVVKDGEVVKLGSVKLTAHLTPGHTPGSTTWTWKSCEGKRCLDIVYADSLTAVNAPGFRFTPMAKSFRASIAKVAALPCDVLLSAHPDHSPTLQALEAHPDGKGVDITAPGQCKAYAAEATKGLEESLAEEKTIDGGTK